jgi:hypothetical protein
VPSPAARSGARPAVESLAYVALLDADNVVIGGASIRLLVKYSNDKEPPFREQLLIRAGRRPSTSA